MMRGSRHDAHLRELIVDRPRLAVGAPLSQVGVLGGRSRRETAHVTSARERGPVAVR